MDQNYNCYTVSCSSPSVFNGRTVGKGDVALLWHKSIDQYVQTLHIDSDRLIAIQLCLPCLSIVVIQVYMSSANHSIQTFKDVIDKLSDTIAIYKEESNIIVMGDFNVQFCPRNVYSGMRSRQNYAKHFANTHDLTVITDSEPYNAPAFTFIPYTDASPTRIDHIRTDNYVESLVQQCSVLEDAPLNVSRHLPVYFSLQTNSDISTGSSSEQFLKLNYAWKKPSELKQYKQASCETKPQTCHSFILRIRQRRRSLRHNHFCHDVRCKSICFYQKG